jgi:hypothetical protein
MIQTDHKGQEAVLGLAEHKFQWHDWCISISKINSWIYHPKP